MTLTLAQAGSFFANGGGLFLAGLAATAVPIAIHLLSRIRRVQVPWGAMKFLLEAYRRHRTRLRIEQWLLLALRCLILAMLGFALAGPRPRGLAEGLGLDAGQRQVHIVLDDSLITRARSGDRARFEALRDTAMRLIDQLAPGDRVALWLAARPAEGLFVPAGTDRAGLRNALTSLQPRYTPSDLTGALNQLASHLSKRNDPPEQVAVVVLSELAADALPRDSGSADLAALGRLAGRFLFSRPGPSLPNAQVMSLTPRRQMLVMQGEQAAAIPLSVKLRRFVEDDATLTTTKLKLTVEGRWGEGEAAGAWSAAPVMREWRWSPGQATGGWDNIEVPIEGFAAALSSDALRGAGAGGLRVVVRASIDEDALTEDNERLAVVELRRSLTVGVVDAEPIAPGPAAKAALRPGQWLDLALRVARQERRALLAGDLTEAALADLDAAMVLRPDRLSERDLVLLRGLAQRGGLVWVFAPAQEGEPGWADRLSRGLQWRWKVEPEAAASADPSGQGLDLGSAAPEALRLLAADWSDLLRPVRVSRWHRLAEVSGADRVWLRVAPAGGVGATGEPLLVTGDLGDGAVAWMGVAIDPPWTNLPAKPLFVPLIHEGLQGLLGASGEGRRLGALLCGDQPALGRGWEGAARLERQVKAEAGASVVLQRTDQGFSPVSPLAWPGVYEAWPTGLGRRLVVNVDADACDTLAVGEARWGEWLKPLGDWGFLDLERPAAGLTREVARANVGWYVLWLVLALAVAELVLARWFSHAVAAKPRPRFNRLLGGVLGRELARAAAPAEPTRSAEVRR